MPDNASEVPSPEEMARRHWEEAFAACRTLIQTRTSPDNPLMIRRAEGVFWGAVAVISTYCDGKGVFNPANHEQGIAYRNRIAQIEEVCAWLPVIPMAIEPDAWEEFFALVEAIAMDAAITIDMICAKLAKLNPACTAVWWHSRALHYGQYDYLPAKTRV